MSLKQFEDKQYPYTWKLAASIITRPFLN